jgi:hypothetical protein
MEQTKSEYFIVATRQEYMECYAFQKAAILDQVGNKKAP